MVVATASRNARSWLTTTSAPLKARSQPSSQPIASRSRWLVGSSSSSSSGAATSARAARQLADAARAVELQLRQRGLHLLLPVPAVERVELRVQRGEVVAGGVLLVAAAQRARVGQAVGDRVEHRRRRLQRRLLRHVRAAQALRALQLARIQPLAAGQHLQQRRLAAAVAADQPAALLRLQHQRRVVQQRRVAVGEVGVGQGQQRHRGSRAADARVGWAAGSAHDYRQPAVRGCGCAQAARAAQRRTATQRPPADTRARRTGESARRCKQAARMPRKGPALHRLAKLAATIRPPRQRCRHRGVKHSLPANGVGAPHHS